MPSSTARWVVVLFCLASSTLLLAQSTGGRILGRVADPSGAVLANVKVTLVNEATGVSRDTQTNEGGDYTFVEVVPGSYHVEFAQAGFKKNVQKSVLVEVNQVVTLNSILQLGEAKETVEVTSEAPLVDTTSTQLGAVVNDRSVNQLPLNAREPHPERIEGGLVAACVVNDPGHELEPFVAFAPVLVGTGFDDFDPNYFKAIADHLGFVSLSQHR